MESAEIFEIFCAQEAYHACLSWFRTHPVKTRKQGEQPSLFHEST